MGNLNFNIGSEFYPNYLNRIPYSWFQFLNPKFLLSSTLGSAAFDTVASTLLRSAIQGLFFSSTLGSAAFDTIASTVLRSAIQGLFSFFFSPLLVDLLNMLNIDDNIFFGIHFSKHFQNIVSLYILSMIGSYFSFVDLLYIGKHFFIFFLTTVEQVFLPLI